MPLSDPETPEGADEAWPAESADDLIARLVEEMAGATGGAVRDNTEIDQVLERLSELRAGTVTSTEPRRIAPVPEPVIAAPEPAPAPQPQPSPLPSVRVPTAATAAPVAAPAPKNERPPFGSPASVDDVILEAVRSAGTQPGAQPILLPARRVPAQRSRPRRSHSSFYLVALFLVTFASGVLLLNRSWFVDQGSSGEYWGEDATAATPPADVAAAPAAGDVADIQLEPELEAGADAAPAGWVRRKVKTYRVDADGAIDYEASADPGSW